MSSSGTLTLGGGIRVLWKPNGLLSLGIRGVVQLFYIYIFFFENRSGAPFEEVIITAVIIDD